MHARGVDISALAEPARAIEEQARSPLFVAVDGEGRYAGLALVAEAHAPDLEADKGLAGILRYADVVLHPGMNVQ